MNHDYAHCADLSEDCPEDCYRRQLTEEAIRSNWTMVSFMHFKGTDECKRNEVET